MVYLLVFHPEKIINKYDKYLVKLRIETGNLYNGQQSDQRAEMSPSPPMGYHRDKFKAHYVFFNHPSKMVYCQSWYRFVDLNHQNSLQISIVIHLLCKKLSFQSL